jgi:integrase
MRNYPIPKYRLHSSGQAAVRLDGRDHYLGKFGTEESKKKYDQLIARWLVAKGKPPVPTDPENVSVDQILGAYWLHAQGYYLKRGKPTGQLQRIKAALGVVRKTFGGTTATEFGPRELKSVREEMIRREWARTYVNALVGCIKRCWRWACEEEIVPAHLWQALSVVRNLQRGRSAARETPAVGPVQDAVVGATLPHLTPEVGDMVRIQRLTGMRPIEVCRMRAEDVDRTGKLPEGRPLKDVWVYRVQEEGNKLAHRGVSRIVLIGPKAQAVLLPHLLRRGPAGYVFSPRDVTERWLNAHGRSPTILKRRWSNSGR